MELIVFRVIFLGGKLGEFWFVWNCRVGLFGMLGFIILIVIIFILYWVNGVRLYIVMEVVFGVEIL